MISGGGRITVNPRLDDLVGAQERKGESSEVRVMPSRQWLGWLIYLGVFH